MQDKRTQRRYIHRTMSAQLTDSELLAELVSFDTVSTKSNLPLVDFISDYLDVSGIELFRQLSADGTKANLIARVGLQHKPDENGLALSGHLDVVPADEPDWHSDPFTLIETDEGFVGRGACDMKGFVALAVNTLRQATAEKLKNPLVLLLSYDEEIGSFGAQQMIEHWGAAFPCPRRVIVGEPTSLRVVRMSKGHLKVRIEIPGVGAHSGFPHLGINAVERAGQVLTRLSTLREKWQEVRVDSSDFFPETPYPALNIATIHGGNAINIVPERCTIEVGIRALPGMDSATLVDQLGAMLTDLPFFDELNVDTVHDNPPMLLQDSAPIHRKLCELFGQQESFGVSYASDAGMFRKGGMDCVIFGPGDIAVAHKPNEIMPKADFARARNLLDKSVGVFCGDIT